MSTSSTPRIRGRRLQAIRMHAFMASPYCARCGEPLMSPAEAELDHIVPLWKGGRDIPENRQVLHVECHRLKTAEDAGYRAKPTIGADGYRIK